jgi:hypothetical protein
VAVTGKFLSNSGPQVVLTLGPVAGPEAPGTRPKLAFQRAKLSSSASNSAYSSALLAALGLYPVELSVRFRTSLIANDDYDTRGETWAQIIFIRGLNCGIVNPLRICFLTGGDVRSYLGNSGSLSVVMVSVERDAAGQRNKTWILSITATTERGTVTWSTLLCPSRSLIAMRPIWKSVNHHGGWGSSSRWTDDLVTGN